MGARGRTTAEGSIIGFVLISSAIAFVENRGTQHQGRVEIAVHIGSQGHRFLAAPSRNGVRRVSVVGEVLVDRVAEELGDRRRRRAARRSRPCPLVAPR